MCSTRSPDSLIYTFCGKSSVFHVLQAESALHVLNMKRSKELKVFVKRLMCVWNLHLLSKLSDISQHVEKVRRRSADCLRVQRHSSVPLARRPMPRVHHGQFSATLPREHLFSTREGGGVQSAMASRASPVGRSVTSQQKRRRVVVTSFLRLPKSPSGGDGRQDRASSRAQPVSD